MTLLTVHHKGPRRQVDAPLVDGPPLVPRPMRRVGYLLALAVWTLPFLIPSGPGNTALADVAIVVTLVMTTRWLVRSGVKAVLPYSLGVGVLMTAGLIAAIHHRAAFSGLSVLQELFLLLWSAAIANAVQRPWVLRVFLQAWCWSGITWASVVVFARMTGLDAVAGVTPQYGGRATLSFHDPNLAANYFLCALMILLATRTIRRRWIRHPGVVVILAAIFFTGSNGAMVALGIGLGVAAVIRLRKARGPLVAIATVALLLVLVAVAGPKVDVSAVRERAASSGVQMLEDSVGRSDTSGTEREILVSGGLRLFRSGDLIGIGPGRTKSALADQGASYVKEAHDDYVATLVERGVLGGVGLIILMATIGVRLGRVALRPLPPDVAALVPRPEYLLGLGLGFVASGFFYEVLHFRHLWAFLGLVAGLDAMVGRRWRR